ncbi:MAG: hypothetical protein O9282_06905 [Flavobacterium sp.]|jgi:hypothetical protein|uniref:hypothetical protein n=1 Tax=Flavobacterium sp. TaxID=239 RepID=UPI0022CD1306|nr:hypothetical protein [Flavobacterium sp.]MCZ8331023.1 hypothetical protein [Flavobacterium sp.]
MKTNIIQKYLIVIISLILFGCPSDEMDGAKSLCIKNTSGATIFFWFSYDFDNYHYPNIILPENIPLLIRGAGNGGCVGNDVGQSPSWENVFSQLPNGKFSIYFFDKLATTQEEWEDIRVNHMVLRKDVTLEELENSNFTIFYP